MRTRVTIYDRVLKLLKADVKYRNSDRKLWLRILDDLGAIVYSDKTNSHWIEVNSIFKTPSYESIRRSRQKVQELHPELQATDPEVRKQRGQKEATKGTFVYRENYNPALERGARV